MPWSGYRERILSGTPMLLVGGKGFVFCCAMFLLISCPIFLITEYVNSYMLLNMLTIPR